MRELGGYSLIAQIGRGGMANVYLATQPVTGELVVLKEPRSDVSDDEDMVTMFLEEARLSLRLKHPHVVRTFDVGVDDGRYFIAMEYLEGQTLGRVRARLAAEPYFLPAMLFALRAALDGLHHAHELRDDAGEPLRLVHRDVTPQNVFVTYGGGVKLVDFGIAKAIGSSVQTRTGVLKGKLKYMAPEQVAAKQLDRRADVYAVGIILWEVLTRSRLFKGLNDAAVIHRVSLGQIPPITSVAPDAPPALVAIAERALASNRDERIPTAAALASELDDYLDASQQHFSRDELAQVMSDHFAAERETAANDIAAHRQVLRDTGMSLPVMHVRQPSMTPTPTGSQGTHAGQDLPLSPEEGSGRGWATVIAVGASAIVAGAITWNMTAEDVTASGTPASTSDVTAAATPGPSAPPVVTEVNLTVDVSPEDAEILLDGQRLSQGDFAGTVDKRGGVRRLTVKAPGHEPRVSLIELDRDTHLSFDLEKRDAKPQNRVRPKPRPLPEPVADEPPDLQPPPAPPPGSDFVKQPRGTKAKPLDEDNPYR